MKRKRYQLTITLAMSATSKKDVKRKFKEIIESGSAVSDNGKLAFIQLTDDPIVVELLF